MSDKNMQPVVLLPWEWDKEISEAVDFAVACDMRLEQAFFQRGSVGLSEALKSRRAAWDRLSRALGPDFAALHLFKLSLDRVGGSAEACNDLVLAKQCNATRAATDALSALLKQRF